MSDPVYIFAGRIVNFRRLFNLDEFGRIILNNLNVFTVKKICNQSITICPVQNVKIAR